MCLLKVAIFDTRSRHLTSTAVVARGASATAMSTRASALAGAAVGGNVLGAVISIDLVGSEDVLSSGCTYGGGYSGSGESAKSSL